jgi:hypothetical protein
MHRAQEILLNICYVLPVDGGHRVPVALQHSICRMQTFITPRWRGLAEPSKSWR